MRDELRAGLDRTHKLLPGAAFIEATAGVSAPFGGALNPFARVEAGVHPTERLDLFGFGQADRFGVQAGVGARVTFP